MHTSALVGALEAINSGVTTILDSCESFHLGEHAEVEVWGLKDSNIRALFCFGMSEDCYGKAEAGKEGWQARLSHIEKLRLAN